MFSRKERLEQKTGPDGVGRYDFLKQLIVEFNTTKSLEAKHQTIANLANFAYDPINYEYMKQLYLIDLFLAQLSENDETLIHFALAGLCNISADPETKEYIIALNGVHLISHQLLHKNEDISLNSITTLYYLLSDSNHLITPEIIDKAVKYELNDNPRLKNLGQIFLSICTPEQLASAKRFVNK